MTGLAAGFHSGFPIFEANSTPGGICSSYYIRPGDRNRMAERPPGDKTYRFENGGGHWIFGADEVLRKFLEKHVELKKYTRRSAVYFSKDNRYVPYPLQNHLRFLDDRIAEKAIAEMTGCRRSDGAGTMKGWLNKSFGPTLCDFFFYPFHELYTAGLYDRIAPQDAYKSPVDLKKVTEGAIKDVSPVGYNTRFLYPRGGLNLLAQRIAAKCNIHYNKQIVKIHTAERVIEFNDGSNAMYDVLISTLPLHTMMRLTGIEVGIKPDPYSSVFVLNIGALRGDKCPDDHWLYTPDTHSGFHRVGFYSNVDRSFLPISARNSDKRVSIYVEKSFGGSMKPRDNDVHQYTRNVIDELQGWKFIKDIEVVDSTWIDVGYTWSWPDSGWRNKAIDILKQNEIFQVGRYGRWVFQGIADSIREGLAIDSRFNKDCIIEQA